MKNKTAALSALSVCISLALNGQALAQTPPPATIAPAETLECPADLSLLTSEEQAALAEQCQAAEQPPEETQAAQASELPAWMTDQTTLLAGGGAAALAATIAIAAGGSSGGGGSGGDRNEGGDGGDGDGNNYEEWEIGNKLEGDNQENTLEGNTSAGEGEIGNLVTGNNTDNTLEGDTDVTEGGKGTVVDGNNTTTTNDGEVTVSGEGSVGLEVNGNNATVTNNGNGDITAGGTGVSVNGDNASVTTTGETSVSGQGSAGTVITGNNATVSNEGNSSVTGGGTGTLITGDNASVSNTGDTSVSGEGSTGIVINGNGSDVTLGGDLVVSGGATGLHTQGNNNAVSNTGSILVTGQNSLGIHAGGAGGNITNIGDIHIFDNGMGILSSGDNNQIMLDGDIYMGYGHAGTAVGVSGDRNQVHLTGGIHLSHEYEMPAEGAVAVAAAKGLVVSGDHNTIILEGSLDLHVDEYLLGWMNQSSITLVDIAGSNNHVALLGGLNMLVESPGARGVSTSALNITGNNTVTVSGHSEVFLSVADPGIIQYIRLDGGSLIFDENATVNFSRNHTYPGYFPSARGHIWAKGSSQVLNLGLITATPGNNIMLAENSASLLNQGHLFIGGPSLSDGRATAMMVNGEDALAVNDGTITIFNDRAPSGATGGDGNLVFEYLENVSMAIQIMNGTAVNQGEIILNGAGTYGIGVARGSAINTGSITLDAMRVVYDEDGNITDRVNVAPSDLQRLGAAIISGSSTGTHQPWATNEGEIHVTNTGYGMLTISAGATAINQGTINLQRDHHDATAPLTGMLATAGVVRNQGEINIYAGSSNSTAPVYAMAATGNGVAINDTTGVININTDLGQAFYTAGNGVIVNRGTVNFNGSPINSGDPNWGSAEFDGTLYESEALLSHTGESVSTTGGIVYLATLGNQGNLTVDHNIRTTQGDWLLNSGTLAFTATGSFSGRLHNTGEVVASGGLDVATLVNEGTVTVNNGRTLVSRSGTGIYNLAGGTITNGAASGTVARTLMHLTNTSTVYNNGDLTATDGYNAIYIAGSSKAWNDENGRITVTSRPTQYGGSAISMVGNAQFTNLGEISVQGSNAVMFNMTAAGNVVVNAGVMNIGTEAGVADGTNGTGLIGVKQSAANVFNNMAGGVINIWADNSYAFEKTNSNARVINNGDVFVHGEGSDIFKGSATATEGDDLSLAELPSIPDVPGMPEARWNVVNNYTVGTNADGSAGTMSGSYLALDGSVKVDTGFVAGTDATRVTFTDVFKAQAVTGEQHIGSTTVVWNASASKNADGNVDVTMTKNDYADVIGDQSLSGVAAALDNGYTSNSLYSSLNVSTSAELDRALKQVSGAQATALNQEARILGQRFTRLAAEAPVTTDTGLSFNVVAKGDKRAEMANKVTYDMVALGQRFESALGELEAHYGMARLSGSGGNAMSRAGDNGLTGGYSQFFGLSHHLNLGDNLGWHNSLRYDRHQLDSRRDIRFEGVRNSARSDVHIQQLALRSEGAKTLNLGDNLHVKPFAGVALRHQMTGGMQERGAGDFNLSMQRYTETAVDAVTGLHLNWSGDRGWGAQAVLEAGPNLAFSRQGRTASLAGASGQQFRVEDGKRGGGVNSQATAGAHYRQGSLDIGANAFHWREDGAQDKGFLLNLTHHF